MLRTQTSETLNSNDGDGWFVGELPPHSAGNSRCSTAQNSPVLHAISPATIKYSPSVELLIALDKLLQTEDQNKTASVVASSGVNQTLIFSSHHEAKHKPRRKKEKLKGAGHQTAIPPVSSVASDMSLSFDLAFGAGVLGSTQTSRASSVNDLAEESAIMPSLTI